VAKRGRLEKQRKPAKKIANLEVQNIKFHENEDIFN
jgi:hypothetical protein